MTAELKVQQITNGVQLFFGFVLLCLVIYTWCRMRKLNTLIVFMKKLLIAIGLKALALIDEAIYMLTLDGAEWKQNETVYVYCACEFVNWICTQLIIFIVALRFYECSIPVKQLENQIKRQLVEANEDAAAIDQKQDKKIWLESRQHRKCFSIVVITVSVVVTAISLLIWSFLLLRIQNGKEKHNSGMWYMASTICFSAVFLCQGLSVALFVAAYTTIKTAAVTLGFKQAEDQTRQLFFMLFNSILIALTYIIWFVGDIVVIFLQSHDRISKTKAGNVEGISRISRQFFQITAFCWILLTFSRYGMAVNERVEKQRRRSTLKQKARAQKTVVPTVQVDMADTPQAQESQVKTFLRSKTINDESEDDVDDTEESDSDGSLLGIDSDEELDFEERLLQKEILKNFVATKRHNNDFSYDGNLAKVSFIQARYSEEPQKKLAQQATRAPRPSYIEDSMADIEENLSCTSVEDY